jgi:hypothetical protein
LLSLSWWSNVVDRAGFRVGLNVVVAELLVIIVLEVGLDGIWEDGISTAGANEDRVL